MAAEVAALVAEREARIESLEGRCAASAKDVQRLVKQQIEDKVGGGYGGHGAERVTRHLHTPRTR